MYMMILCECIYIYKNTGVFTCLQSRCCHNHLVVLPIPGVTPRLIPLLLSAFCWQPAAQCLFENEASCGHPGPLGGATAQWLSGYNMLQPHLVYPTVVYIYRSIPHIFSQ